VAWSAQSPFPLPPMLGVQAIPAQVRLGKKFSSFRPSLRAYLLLSPSGIGPLLPSSSSRSFPPLFPRLKTAVMNTLSFFRGENGLHVPVGTLLPAPRIVRRRARHPQFPEMAAPFLSVSSQVSYRGLTDGRAPVNGGSLSSLRSALTTLPSFSLPLSSITVPS